MVIPKVPIVTIPVTRSRNTLLVKQIRKFSKMNPHKCKYNAKSSVGLDLACLQIKRLKNV